jgi:hypothetical protein
MNVGIATILVKNVVSHYNNTSTNSPSLCFLSTILEYLFNKINYDYLIILSLNTSQKLCSECHEYNVMSSQWGFVIFPRCLSSSLMAKSHTGWSPIWFCELSPGKSSFEISVLRITKFIFLLEIHSIPTKFFAIILYYYLHINQYFEVSICFVNLSNIG